MSADADKTSLSKYGPKPTDVRPRDIKDFKGLAEGTKIKNFTDPSGQSSTVESLKILVEDLPDGFVCGFLHLPAKFAKGIATSPHQTAAILVSGAGGGVVGPSSIYLGIAAKLASLEKGIPCLRLDYRYPARNKYCISDLRSAMDLLQDLYGLKRFVLVGWSFGGAPVLTVGGEDQRVVGCATVASQTASTDGIWQLSPRPLLLLHGTGDQTLNYSCSEKLFTMYGSNGDRKLELFENDDHALTRNAEKAEEMLCRFIVKCAGSTVNEIEHKQVLESKLLEDGERVENMKKGGDLAEPEKLT